MFLPLAGYVLCKGFYAACARPVQSPALNWYRACQAIISILWLIFSIINTGAFDGWARIGSLKHRNSGTANFCIFLLVIEALSYMYSSIMGVVCLLQIGSVAEQDLGTQFPISRA